MTIKGQRAGDKAGDTGKGQSSLAVQAGVRGHCFPLWQEALSKVLKLG